MLVCGIRPHSHALRFNLGGSTMIHKRTAGILGIIRLFRSDLGRPVPTHQHLIVAHRAT